MKCIGIAWLALATIVRVFGQDAPSALQARSDARKDVAAQSSVLAKEPNLDVSGIVHSNGSDEMAVAENGNGQMVIAREKFPEAPERDEWIQDHPTEGKPSKAVKKVAKTRNQAKPEKLDSRSARGPGANRPSARRPNGAGRPDGVGRPAHRNR